MTLNDLWDSRSTALAPETINYLTGLFTDSNLETGKFPVLWYFHGENGTGKTHMAGIFRRELHTSQIYSQFTVAVEEYVYVRDRTFRDKLIACSRDRDNPSAYEETLRNAKQAVLLVVDEFGRSSTEYGFSTWLEIIDYRLAQKDKITVVISNYDLREIAEMERRLTGNIAIRSRLYDAQVLSFGGVDYRKLRRGEEK